MHTPSGCTPARRGGALPSRRWSSSRTHAGPPRPPPRDLATTTHGRPRLPPPYTTFPASTPLSPTLSISRLVLGTMQFGEGIERADAHALCSAAVERGITSFDTAEMYPVPQSARTAGASEAILGSWLKARKRRDDVQVITKVAGPGGMPWLRGGPSRLDGAALTAALDASLARLGTDSVDLLLLHWPDRYVPLWGETEYDVTRAYGGATPVEEAWAAAEAAVTAGKARAVGLSNETAWGLGRVLGSGGGGGGGAAPGGGGGRPPVAALQNAYSLLARDFDATLAETCAAGGVPLLAYAPLAGGLLSGKYRLGERRRRGRRRGGGGGGGGGGGEEEGEGEGGHGWWWAGPPAARFVRYAGRYAEGEARYGPSTRARAALAAYARLAAGAGVTPAALALRWVLGRPLVGAAVLGVTGPGQLEEAVAAAAAGPLGADVLASVDRVHARWPNPTP